MFEMAYDHIFYRMKKLMGMVLSIGLLAISGCGKSQTAIAPKDLLTMAKGGSYEFTKSEYKWLKNTCTDEKFLRKAKNVKLKLAKIDRRINKIKMKWDLEGVTNDIEFTQKENNSTNLDTADSRVLAKCVIYQRNYQ